MPVQCVTQYQRSIELSKHRSRGVITYVFKQECVIIIIILLFQEDNIFGANASLTFGPRLQRYK